MYSLKINNNLIDSKIVDESVMNMKISTEKTRFSAKASMVNITLHGKFKLDSKHLNIIEIYSDSIRIWLGFADETTYSYDYDKDITKFTCYDFMKKFSEIWDSSYEEYHLLGLKISDIAERVLTMVGNYILEKAGWLPALSKNILESDSAMVNKVIRGIDENGTSYEVINNRVTTEIQGLRFAFDESAEIGLFCEQINRDDNDYYIGVIDGVFAYYFSGTNGIRKKFYTEANYASPIYYEILDGEKIAMYWWKRPNATTIEFEVSEVSWGGIISAERTILVSNAWPYGYYPSRKLIYVDGELNIQVGDGKEVVRADLLADLGGYDYGTENNEPLKYSGGLSKFFRYPYWYETTEDYEPNCYKVMNDLAVYFDGFYSFYDGVLRFTCESSCTAKNISYFNYIQKGKKELTYDLSDSLHPNSSYYRDLLESYYNDTYGNKYNLFSLKTFDEVNILNTINGMRVIDISGRKGVNTVTLIKGGN